MFRTGPGKAERWLSHPGARADDQPAAARNTRIPTIDTLRFAPNMISTISGWTLRSQPIQGGLLRSSADLCASRTNWATSRRSRPHRKGHSVRLDRSDYAAASPSERRNIPPRLRQNGCGKTSAGPVAQAPLSARQSIKASRGVTSFNHDHGCGDLTHAELCGHPCRSSCAEANQQPVALRQLH